MDAKIYEEIKQLYLDQKASDDPYGAGASAFNKGMKELMAAHGAKLISDMAYKASIEINGPMAF